MNGVKKSVKKALDNSFGKKELKISELPRNCSVVSFDIFDTLIKRDVRSPEDVFRLLQLQNRIPDFAQKRIQAETLARKKTVKGEVLLADIYRCFPGLTEEQAKEYCAREEEMEEAICCANLDVLDFYYGCTKERRVVLFSDMYLSSDFLRRLLTNCGINGYEKIYISGEFGASKSKGLFQIVCEDLAVKPKDILHIGNSFRADYLWAMRSGVRTWKIPTITDRMLTSRKTVMKISKPQELRALRDVVPFLNNHTTAKLDERSYYYKYGYENFGILLVGFCRWLFFQMKEQGIQQALFVARDGFLIKQVYDMMGYSKVIPSYYFEMSRRSIRVPASLSKNLPYDEMLTVIPVLRRTSVERILDGWGLSAEEAEDALTATGLRQNTMFWKSELQTDASIKTLYELLKPKIQSKASEEQSKMLDYVRQFHLEKPTALIDIGYNGTIQKELLKANDDFALGMDLYGYYLMLNEPRKGTVVNAKFRAKGYVWDHFNGEKDKQEQNPYVGLYETFFLERTGSVKCYIKNGSHIAVERYPYEYDLPGGLVDEVSLIKDLQKGALAFAQDYADSPLADLITLNQKEAFLLMKHSLMEPSAELVKRFGSFRFFDSGEARFLARPRMSLPLYIIHPKDLSHDFFESMWKVGFLKAILKVNISYERLWTTLKCFYTWCLNADL